MEFERLREVWGGQKVEPELLDRASRTSAEKIDRRARLERRRSMWRDAALTLAGIACLALFARFFARQLPWTGYLGLALVVGCIVVALPAGMAVRLRYRPRVANRSLMECLRKESERLGTLMWIEKLHGWLVMIGAAGLGIFLGAARPGAADWALYSAILLGFLLAAYWRDSRAARRELGDRRQALDRHLRQFEGNGEAPKIL